MSHVAAALRRLATKLRDAPGAGIDLPALTTAKHEQAIAAVLEIVDEVEYLAAEAEFRDIDFREFRSLVDRLRSVGKTPPGNLVIKVERAIADALVARCRAR